MICYISDFKKTQLVRKVEGVAHTSSIIVEFKFLLFY